MEVKETSKERWACRQPLSLGLSCETELILCVCFLKGVHSAGHSNTLLPVTSWVKCKTLTHSQVDWTCKEASWEGKRNTHLLKKQLCFEQTKCDFSWNWLLISHLENVLIRDLCMYNCVFLCVHGKQSYNSN